MSNCKNWGIVGGGIMGLTLALRLAKKGHKVTVYEAAEDFGGLASSWKLGDLTWDKFYHVILLSDFKTRGLLNEIGLENELNWVETKTGFYIDGKLYSISDAMEFLKFPTLSLIDKFRLGITILAASKITDWRKLEKIPVTEWLIKWSGKNTFEKIWLPLLRAKLGESYKKTSAVFIWATIQRLYGARRSGLKKEMFGYVNGGYKTIIEALLLALKKEQVVLKSGHKVQSIVKQPNAQIKITFDNKHEAHFDEVIVTLPSGMAANIIPDLSSNEKSKLQNINYLGVICMAVLMDKPISPFYITNITDQRFPFTGVIEMSALVDKKVFNGQSLIYLPKYVDSNDPMMNESNESIQTYFLEQFKKMYPEITDTNIRYSAVAKAKHVITVAEMNYSEKLPAINTSIEGLYIINTSHIKDGTLNVNETIKVADSKLAEILTS